MFLSMVLCSELCSGLTRASMMTVVKTAPLNLANASPCPRENVTVTHSTNSYPGPAILLDARLGAWWTYSAQSLSVTIATLDVAWALSFSREMGWGMF